MQEYIEIFKALSDETRLRILNLLLTAQTALCVCEFTDVLEIPQYNISRHLKILKNVGLIRERKEGRWVYFSLSTSSNGFYQAILEAIKHIPSTLLLKDQDEIDKRLNIRIDGKCHLGIQKEHLKGKSNPTLTTGELTK